LIACQKMEIRIMPFHEISLTLMFPEHL